MDPVFLDSQKGKEKLIFKGHLYVASYTLKSGERKWECSKRKSLKCNGKVLTANRQVKEVLGEHNHAENPSACEANVIMSDVRKRAKSSLDKPINVISQATSGVSEAIIPALPSHRNIGRTVSRLRKNDLPALPQSVQDLVIPDKFQKTITGSQFLRYDSGPTSQRMLVFTTDENLQLLNQSSQWFMDGTFKTSPSLFQQLYTVHGCVNGKVVPMVYALLTNKSQQGYEDLLRQIKLLKPGISPTQFLLDFEHAAVNAVRSEFPLAQLRGCFFHFQQSIWRHIQQVASISASYRSDPDFALQMRRLPALAFWKVADARTSYLELVREPFFMTVEMLEFLEYFERTWIGQPPIGNRTWWTDPIFPLELWNCFEAVNHGWARTNNSVEGWHSRFQSLVGIAHPNIYAFITCLQKEEDMTRQPVANLSSGGTPRQPNARYLRLNERLQRIVADYNNLSIPSYLKNIATNLAFV